MRKFYLASLTPTRFSLWILTFLLFSSLTMAATQNDSEPQEVSYIQSGFQKDRSASLYIYENFNAVFNDQIPEGWDTGNPMTFKVRASGGVADTKRLARRFDGAQTDYWQTPLIDLGVDPFFSFQYRVVDQLNYPNTATLDYRFQLNFSISTDNGQTFVVFLQRGRIFPHSVQTAYQNVAVDLSAYQGQEVIIRMDAVWYSGSFWVDFDDIIIGSYYNVNFSVSNGLEPLAGAVINTPGKPFLSATTDVVGQAAMVLPQGSTDFRVTAQNYLTYDSNLTLVDQDITVPEIQLIGNFTRTFEVTDQDGTALQGVLISYEGTAQSYTGPQIVQGSLTTNASGIASVALANGEYTFTASKADYYQQSGSFSMNNAAITEALQMQIYPLVIITVTGDTEGGGQEPLQGASVVINEMSPLSTNAAGQVAKRLPIGSQSYTASRIGYIAGSADFEIISNDDLSLPALNLALAPTIFSFVYPVSQELSFRNTLVGKSSPQLNVTFTNTGSGTLTIDPSDVSITGVDAAHFSLINLTEPVALATGQEASVGITFTPQSYGQKTAQLHIEDNLGLKAIQTVTLMGEAYEATVLPFANDFEENSFGNWIVINGTQTNQWHIGTPTGDTDNLAAIVSQDGGVTNTYKLNTDGLTYVDSKVYFYQDFEVPAFAEGQVKLQFSWKGVGQPSLDRMRVFIADPGVNPLAGQNLVNIYPGSIALLGNFENNAQWQTTTINLAAAHHGQQRRIIFHWINNNDGTGAQPPAAVDNIYVGAFYELILASNPPAAAASLEGAGSFGAGFSVPVEAVATNGYTFLNWTAPVGSFADASLAATTFIMPAQGVTATANFAVNPPVVENLIVDYDGLEHTLTATATEGFDIVWYDSETGGNIIAPSATLAGSYNFWAAAKDADGAESIRVEATLTIQKAVLEVSAIAQTKEYGDGDPALEYTITGGELYLDDQLIGALSREAGENAGSYEILAGTLQNPNYEIDFITALFSITPAPLTATADDKVKYFDGNPFPVENYTVSYSGFKFSDNAGMLSGILIFTGSAIDATEPGEYEIIPGGLTSDNYTIAFASGSLTISELIVLTIEGLVVEDKIYDGSNTAVLNFENANLMGVEEGDIVFLETTGVVAQFATVNVGSGIAVNYSGLVIAGEDSFKYLLSLPSLTGNILPRPLEITVEAGQSKIFGESDPAAFTYTLTDGELIAEDQLSGALIREEGESVGTWGILQGTLAAGVNYTISFVPDVFTIFALLTLETSPAGAGILDGGGQYLTDDQVSITASPATEFFFISWMDAANNVISTEPNFVFTMPGANIILTAHFAPITYELTLQVEPADAGTVTGEGTYEAGEEVTVNATSAAEFSFAGWYDGDNLLSNQTAYTFSMPSSDLTLVAMFEALPPVTYILTLLADPVEGGSVSGEGEFEEGESVTITATSADGYLFVRWKDAQDNELSTAAAFTFDMPAENMTLTAIFNLENSVGSVAEKSLVLFPNPASHQFTVESGTEIISIEISDITGKRIDGAEINAHIATFMINGYQSGIYLVRILTRNGVLTRKLHITQ